MAATAQQIDDWVDAHKDELVAYLQQLVRIPSESLPPEGHEAAAQEFVAESFRKAGADVDVFDPIDVPGLTEHPVYHPVWGDMDRNLENRPCVVGVFKGSGGGKSILMSSHIDTVGADDPALWTEAPPFSAEIIDGKMYGRGTYDTKAGIATGLFAVRCLRELGLELNGDVIVESVSDEEFGGSHGTLACRLKGYNADIAINCEPTNMHIAAATRGGGQWKITVEGEAGMALGGVERVSSSYKIAWVIEALRQYNLKRNADIPTPPLYAHEPGLPLYVSQIGGGGHTFAEDQGAAPPSCYANMWCEVYPGTTEEDHIAEDHDLREQLSRRHRGLRRRVSGVQAGTAFSAGQRDEHRASHLSPTWRTPMQSADREYVVQGAPFASDGYVFNLHSPTPVVTVGVGGDNAHAPNEYIHVQDLIDLTRIFARTMVSWCG